ncbi:MAG: carbamoyltransferase HypF [Campylobacterales bacterium]
MNMRQRRRYLLRGIVQGVGFRPFVWRIANEAGLTGFVRNGLAGVEIEAEGSKEALERFEASLFGTFPPLARIDHWQKIEIEARGDEAFVILSSEAKEGGYSMVPPDIALCPACLSEMNDPSNRRYRYPFINCTDCGPRYTIIRRLPYDRSNTSMADFPMCAACAEEYANPLSRRYHAEPISCPDCGPTLSLLYPSGESMGIGGDEAIEATVSMLKEGAIVAVKGIGGFHLVCDATNEKALRRLRERKRRPRKPFALMVASLAAAKEIVELDEAQSQMLTSWQRPILLARRREGACVAPSVAFELRFLGVMLPYAPLQQLLLERMVSPVVATSANIAEEPIITAASDVVARLGGVVDAILDHDRAIVAGCDDSVVRMVEGRPIFIRRARGFAPYSLTLPRPVTQPLLGVGAQQKSTIALAFDTTLVISPHIGDLEGVRSEAHFEQVVHRMESLYSVTPAKACADHNQAYRSTQYARRRFSEVATIQHHEAHLWGALLEAGWLERPILGVIWDGTGLGVNHEIWGGEFFLYDQGVMERIGHLAPLGLLGGEAAIREPRRVALWMFWQLHGEAAFSSRLANEAFTTQELALLAQLARGGKAIPTTSIGRLVDGVAALLGVVYKSGFEGEAGIVLEGFYDPGLDLIYPMRWEGSSLSWHEAVAAVVAEGDLVRGATGFLNALAEAILSKAASLSLPVVCSGGVFQNAALVGRLLRGAAARGIELFIPSILPPNDASIAAGQIIGQIFSHRS